MSMRRSEVKRLESVASFCVLGVLVLIVAGIAVKQFRYDIGRFGIAPDTSETTSALSAKEPGTGNSGGSLLNELVPAQFRPLSEPSFYTADNLYEKINGKAPLYLESGFEKLFTRRLISRSQADLWMELFVYDMGTAKNAFSVYSVQKRSDAETLPGKRFAYKTANTLYLAAGRYYVEMVGSAASDILAAAMLELAEKINENPAVGDTAIPELELFGKEGLTADSIKLHPAGVFGFDGLSDTFTAQYRLDTETVTAFFSKRASSREALQLARQYYQFLLDNGGRDILAEEPDIKMVDFYGTIEIIRHKGAFVFGVHEARDAKSAVKLSEKLAENFTD